MGLKVYEVYPYASRVLLNIAPKAKKRKREGLQEIILSLSRYIETPELSHDEVDAVISALTVREFVLGRGSSVEGEGEIILPRVVE
jgi:predicted nuclease with RNAse H fold